jgi:hypothetical protein
MDVLWSLAGYPTTAQRTSDESSGASGSIVAVADIPPTVRSSAVFNALTTVASVFPNSAAEAPTLLPESLASLITAVSLAARISLRGSALFIEAMLEGARGGTLTGLSLTRHALIAAVGSARALHYASGGKEIALLK